MSLRYACPACHEEMTVRFLGAGETARCPHCGVESRVPEGAQAVDAPSTRHIESGTAPMLPRRVDEEKGGAGSKPPPRYMLLRVLAWIIIVGAVLHASSMLVFFSSPSRFGIDRGGIPLFPILLFLAFEIIVAIGIAQGIWAILEIVANTRAVLPPPVDAFD